MRIAPPVDLSPEQRNELERWARRRSLPARVGERARIVLQAAEGLENQQIAQRMSITPEKVARWRKRFLKGGTAALKKDAPRPGRAVKAGGRLVQQAGVKLDQPKDWEVGEEVALKEGWRLERRPAPVGAFRPERKTPSFEQVGLGG